MSVAVVTGASRGLGQGIASALAATGFDIVVGYRDGEVGAKETARLVEAHDRSASLVAGDVRERATHDALAAAALELGSVEVWVNNAGVSVLGPLVTTTAEELRDMFEVNVVGVLHGLHVATSVMRGAGGGRIINIASELGVLAFANLGGYAATKFAVVGLTQAAAIELAAHGIAVNAVCPGTAETDMVMAERRAEVGLTGATPEQVRQSYLDGIPTGRFCTPADVGGLVAYLASPAAAYVTGQAICVNGGSVLR